MERPLYAKRTVGVEIAGRLLRGGAALRTAVRCWGELVLDRIEEVFAESWPAEAALIGGDAEWQGIVELELVPNPDLDAAGRALIQEQYGMREGSKVVRVR
jgi:hypothetical protein